MRALLGLGAATCRTRALACVALAASLAGCSTLKYLGEQGLGQFRLLRARRRIGEVLGDPTVPAQTKSRLALAWAARQFGVERLGLRDGDAFTRFLDTHGEPVAWNVSAAEKTRLKAHVHHFPITGTVPYLGFFRERDARREAAKLEARGFDVFVRPVAGYSTLGVLADPIYSSMLEGTEAHVVEVTLHEMLHDTIWLPGHADWNESLATFVGLRGAALFFAQQSAASGEHVLAIARERAKREQAFSDFLRPLVDELKTLYALPISDEEKLRRRELVFARARAEFLRRFPVKQGAPLPSFIAQPLNNAVVIAFAVYHESAPDHERIFRRVGFDLPRFVELYKKAMRTSDPIGYLRRR